MLGPLLGQTADSSATYAAHFDNNSSVTRDFLGAVGLIIAAALLIWTVIAARYAASASQSPTRRDLAVAFGLVAAAVMMTSAGLLMTVPFTIALGGVTSDTGFASEVQSGIAHAGSVVLFVSLFPLAIAVVLLGKLGYHGGNSPRWIAGTAWVAAVLLAMGFTVGLLLPVPAWFIAFGATWREIGSTAAPGPETR